MEYAKQFMKRGEFAVSCLCVLLLAILAAGGETFFTETNFNSLQKSVAPSAIVALGMLLLLVCGVFDLSVGSAMCLSAVVCANTLDAGCPVAVGILAALACGAAIGALNGLMVAHFGINPLIATMGMQYMAYGLAMKMGDLYQKAPSFPPVFNRLGSGQALNLFFMTWILLLLLAGITVFLRYFHAGRKLYFIGGNRDAAELMGFSAKTTMFWAYVATGILVGLAAVLSVAYDGNASRYLGSGLELNFIIACILGGASLAGGKGSGVGVVLGVVAMSLVSNAFNLLRVPSQFRNVTIGILLIAVVAVDGYIALRKNRMAEAR